MAYEVTGAYPAPDFFTVDAESGVVSIKRDLRVDSLQLNAYTVSSQTKTVKSFII